MRRFFGEHYISIAAVVVFSLLTSAFFGFMAYGEKMKYDAERASDEASDMLALAGALSRAASGGGAEQLAELLVLTDRCRLNGDAKCGIRRAVHDAESGDFAAIAELDERIVASAGRTDGAAKSIRSAIEDYFSEVRDSPLAEYSVSAGLPSVAPRSLHISELSAKDKKCRTSFFGRRIKMRHGYIGGDYAANAEYTENAYYICSVGADDRTQIWNPAGITDRCRSFTDVENEVGEIMESVNIGRRALSVVSCGLYGDTVFYSFSDAKSELFLVVGVAADSGKIVFFASAG